MPTKFADIAKKSSDLLSEDYFTGISLKCKKNAGPVGVTIETERGGSGTLSSKVGTKFSYGGVSFDKVQVKADGGQVLETSLPICKPVLLTFKGGKGADLGLEYTNPKANLVATATMDVKDWSKVSTSACMGVASAGILVGADATYSLSAKSSSPCISAYNVGASYTKGPLVVSVTSAAKVSQWNLGTLYKVNDSLTLATSTTHSSAKPVGSFTVGGAYKASFGTVKAKVSSGGKVDAVLIKEVAPKVDLKASGSISALDPATFRYGIGIIM